MFTGAPLSNMRRWVQLLIKVQTTGFFFSLGFHPNSTILSAIPRPVVTSGGNVTLQCESQEPFNTFILMKDGKNFSSSVSSLNMSSRLFGAVFTVGPVTANQRWRFTCYGYHGSTPQLWSVPSNHLELLVSGKEVQEFHLSVIVTDTRFQTMT